MIEKEKSIFEYRARVLAALANSSRLLMLENMGKHALTVSQLTDLVDLDISTVSRHLSVLKQVGIITCTPDGNRRLYSLRAPCVLGFLECVDDILEEDSGICTKDIHDRMEISS